MAVFAFILIFSNELISKDYIKYSVIENRIDGSYISFDGGDNWTSYTKYQDIHYRLVENRIDGKYESVDRGVNWKKVGDSADSVVVTLYPNPVSDLLYFKCITQSSMNVQIQIINLLGEILCESSCTLIPGMVVNSIDIHTLTPGFYFLHFDTDIQQFCCKFSVVK
jgi:hypothetical protein